MQYYSAELVDTDVESRARLTLQSSIGSDGSVQSDESCPQRVLSLALVSDSHNACPDIPLADVLIHAGDLTQNGTFDELSTQLL